MPRSIRKEELEQTPDAERKELALCRAFRHLDAVDFQYYGFEEQTCITDEIGAGQMETIRTPGHGIVVTLRPRGGTSQGVISWGLEWVLT
jgi:hypothetical protein